MLKWVNQGLVEIIGPIRQEILSGIRGPSKFDVVKDRLRAFPDLEIGTDENRGLAGILIRGGSKGTRDHLPTLSFARSQYRTNLRFSQTTRTSWDTRWSCRFDSINLGLEPNVTTVLRPSSASLLNDRNRGISPRTRGFERSETCPASWLRSRVDLISPGSRT